VRIVKATSKAKKILIIGMAALFIFLMTASMFAGPLLQSFGGGNGEKKVELPTTSIVEHELTVEQENLLKLDGKTIIKFYHNLACDTCLAEKQFFEALTTQKEFSEQVILEEITGNNTAELPSASMHSYIGQRFLVKGYTQDDVVEALCSVMIKPPVLCAVKNV
jgi:hypothetical protein